MWWCHWTRHTWFPVDIYSNHMSISHHLALIGTQNIFSYLLSLGPNYEKSNVQSQGHWHFEALYLVKEQSSLWLPHNSSVLATRLWLGRMNRRPQRSLRENQVAPGDPQLSSAPLLPPWQTRTMLRWSSIKDWMISFLLFRRRTSSDRLPGKPPGLAWQKRCQNQNPAGRKAPTPQSPESDPNSDSRKDAYVSSRGEVQIGLRVMQDA